MTGAHSYEIDSPVTDWSWTETAACVEQGKGWHALSTRQQIKACYGCPVLGKCRESAVAMYQGRLKAAVEDRVVYGGWTADELVAAVKESSHV